MYNHITHPEQGAIQPFNSLYESVSLLSEKINDSENDNRPVNFKNVTVFAELNTQDDSFINNTINNFEKKILENLNPEKDKHKNTIAFKKNYDSRNTHLIILVQLNEYKSSRTKKFLRSCSVIQNLDENLIKYNVHNFTDKNTTLLITAALNHEFYLQKILKK